MKRKSAQPLRLTEGDPEVHTVRGPPLTLLPPPAVGGEVTAARRRVHSARRVGSGPATVPSPPPVGCSAAVTTCSRSDLQMGFGLIDPLEEK